MINNKSSNYILMWPLLSLKGKEICEEKLKNKLANKI